MKKIIAIFCLSGLCISNFFAQESVKEDKPSDKIQHSFVIRKILIKAGIEKTYRNPIKTIYEKPTTNIILSDEKLKVSPLK